MIAKAVSSTLQWIAAPQPPDACLRLGQPLGTPAGRFGLIFVEFLIHEKHLARAVHRDWRLAGGVRCQTKGAANCRRFAVVGLGNASRV